MTQMGPITLSLGPQKPYPFAQAVPATRSVKNWYMVLATSTRSAKSLYRVFTTSTRSTKNWYKVLTTSTRSAKSWYRVLTTSGLLTLPDILSDQHNHLIVILSNVKIKHNPSANDSIFVSLALVLCLFHHYIQFLQRWSSLNCHTV